MITLGGLVGPGSSWNVHGGHVEARGPVDLLGDRIAGDKMKMLGKINNLPQVVRMH